MIEALCKPGRDPREDLPPPIFRKDVVKFEDLQAGMELRGTVLNVVDFGAFVDVGLSDSGLVHISQLSAGYVRDPHDVVAVGDQVRVWVSSIDKDRRRVALTMIAPGTERPKPEKSRRPRPRPHARTDRSDRDRRLKPRTRRRQASRDAAAAASAAPRGKPRATIVAAAAAPAAHRRIRKASCQNNSCRSPRRWRKARNICAPSATCCSFIRRRKSRTSRNRVEPTTSRRQFATARRVESESQRSRPREAFRLLPLSSRPRPSP